MLEKDHLAFAAALRLVKPPVAFKRNRMQWARYQQWMADCDVVAGVLLADNPAFEIARFLIACGMPTHASITIGSDHEPTHDG